MDAKADRKQKVLIVHNLHFEDVKLDEQVSEKLVQSLKAFVKFNGCREIVFTKSNKPGYLKKISKAFTSLTGAAGS